MYTIKTAIAHPALNQIRIIKEILKRYGLSSDFSFDIVCEEQGIAGLYKAARKTCPVLVVIDDAFLTPCINLLTGECEVIVITNNRSAASSGNIHYMYTPVQVGQMVEQVRGIFSKFNEMEYKEKESAVHDYINSIEFPSDYCSSIDHYCAQNRLLLQNGLTPFYQRQIISEKLRTRELGLNSGREKAVHAAMQSMQDLYNPYALRLIGPTEEVTEEDQSERRDYVMGNIQLHSLPEKREYIQGEPIDLAGGSLSLEKEDGSADIVPMDMGMLQSGSTQNCGEQVVELSYLGHLFRFKISVLPGQADFPEPQDGIDYQLAFIRQPEKSVFTKGDLIDRSKLLVKLVDVKDKSFEVVRDFSIYPDRPLEENDTEIIISCKNVKCEPLKWPIKVEKRIKLATVISSMPAKLEYVQGTQELDLSGGQLMTFYSDGSNESIKMTQDMVSGFDSSTVGPQLIYVQDLPMQIVIAPRKEQKIEVIRKPDKTEYIAGESLDLSGLVLQLTYDNGDTEPVTDFTLPEPVIVSVGQAVVKLDYHGLPFPVFIHVKDFQIVGIQMTKLPDKLSYLEYRDTLDVTGARVAKILDNGQKEEIPLTPQMTSGFNNKTPGICTVTVTYEGHTCTFDVMITKKKMTGLKVTHGPLKTSYSEQEAFNPDGIRLQAAYDNNTFENITEFDFVPKTLSLGDTLVTLSAGGCQAQVQVQVCQREVESIVIAKTPAKMHYKEGIDDLDVSGGELLVIYNNGTADTVPIQGAMVEGFDNTHPGENKLKIRYDNAVAEYSVIIDPKVLLGITIAVPPVKTAYCTEETFDPAGMKLMGYYDNGMQSEITGYDYSPNRPLQLSDSVIAISYLEKYTFLPISVHHAPPDGTEPSQPEAKNEAGQEPDVTLQQDSPSPETGRSDVAVPPPQPAAAPPEVSRTTAVPPPQPVSELPAPAQNTTLPSEKPDVQQPTARDSADGKPPAFYPSSLAFRFRSPS